MNADRIVRIIDQKEISTEVYYLKLTREGDFLPGQILALTDKIGGTARYYSIASGLGDDYFGILYNRVHDGWLTPWMSGLGRSDQLYASQPFGEFLPVHSPMVWIATGTGIAPFYSMMKSGSGTEPILIHGARQKEDFFFYDYFRSEMKDRYIPCSSLSLSQHDGFYPGRLTGYLKEEFSFPEASYYLCGSSAMVVDIRDLLLSKGVRFDRITSEIYF